MLVLVGLLQRVLLGKRKEKEKRFAYSLYTVEFKYSIRKLNVSGVFSEIEKKDLLTVFQLIFEL